MDWRILYNPMAVLRRGNALLAALVVIIILTAVAWWGGVHLDGALDLHINPVRPSAGLVIMESLIDWISLAVLLFAASRIFGGNGGVAGHFAATGLARFPYIIFALLFSPRYPIGQAMLKAVKITQSEIIISPQLMQTPLVIFGTFIAGVFLLWTLTILGFSHYQTSRLSIGKTIASFVIGLALAEAVSLVIIRWPLFKIGI